MVQFRTGVQGGGWPAIVAALLAALLLGFLAAGALKGTATRATLRLTTASLGGGGSSSGGAVLLGQQQEPEPEPELPQPRLEDVPLMNADSPYNLSMGDYDMPLPVRPLRDFVTFIVPSLGRPTLNRTLESLINQTMPHSWRAIVLFDGLPLQHVDAPLLSDPRVRTVYLDRRMGAGNGGGGVRNLAARLARTPWVALCDDDDTLHPRYAERLLYETQHFPTAECVDFKMFLNDYIEPGDTQGIYIGMGISFAMRRSTMLEGFNFVPSYKEDGEFLLMYQESRRPILISPFICYCVRAPCSRPAKHDARWRGLKRFLIK